MGGKGVFIYRPQTSNSDIWAAGAAVLEFIFSLTNLVFTGVKLHY